MIAALFWGMSAVVAFAYAGYPLAMALQAKLRPRPRVVDPAWRPQVDVLLVVHDAAAAVGAKIDNLLRLDYPAHALRVHVACDGCRDGTETAARAFDPIRVRVSAFPERRGKSACIADLLPKLQGEVVLFTDVRQPLDPGAATALVAALSDPVVGAASGELAMDAGSGYGRGIDAYWRYEKLLRRLETASGSIIGATGALYAARRALLRSPPPGLILDDMWIPLAIAADGHRVVAAPAAMAFDQGARDARSEQARKRRTLAGNYQLLHRWPALAIPGAHPLALRLWGHKWLRLLAPWCLLGMLLASAWLARDSHLFQVLFALQAIAYAMALAGLRWPGLADRALPVRLCSAFFSLNLSAFLAMFDYARNPRAYLWTVTAGNHAASSHAPSPTAAPGDTGGTH